MKNTVNCIIIDDEEMATKVIASHLEYVPEFTIVGIYHSAVEAFLAVENLEVDVMFLDIQMPKITGLSMLKMLKKQPLTVLTTAHREYALEGFELEVVDYLLKPIGLQRFLQTISKLKRMLSTNTNTLPQDQSIQENSITETTENEPHIFIKSERAFVKIVFATILQVEAIKNHIKIVTTQGTHITLMPISEFENKLPPNDFIRIHRSFIINIHHVVRFDNHNVTNRNGVFPIGRSYKEISREVLNKRLINQKKRSN
ncbi:LytTR family DNA-binding domain-containing protein [Aquimarina sp. MMG016]|uniref:LytR/AlgR family response regulator transcription factor n=1 Tax=Aquimarina sp. MMG016 TaxID=2822690 RepID=UPI001B3A21DA|nr:LytTR family DNA-binding domain-containing protein [Aquimarina sp. MMG016]MBQ4822371.1 response regulator transcription factor [Aquimarina sp. MMG016]